MAFAAVVIVGVIVAAFFYPIHAMIVGHSNVAPLIIIGWGVLVLGTAIFIAGGRARTINDGHEDLTVHVDDRAITLPHSFGRLEPVAIGFDQVQDVGVVVGDVRRRHGTRMDTVAGPDGVEVSVRGGGDVYTVVLRWSDGKDQAMTEPLVGWSDQPRARLLAAWLAQQTGAALRQY